MVIWRFWKSSCLSLRFFGKLLLVNTVRSIIDRAHDYYFNQWRGSEKVCPAFAEKVYVSGLGWRHIAKHPRRLLVDKLIRLRNLRLAREVLEESTTYQTVQQKGKYILYGFRAIKGDRVIKVVVSSRGKEGKKILYSVMFKSISRQEQRNIVQHNKKIVDEFRRKSQEK